VLPEVPPELSVTVKVPDLVPMVVGVKVTFIVQVLDAARLLPHVPVCAKSPVTTILAIVRVAVPVLLRVTA